MISAISTYRPAMDVIPPGPVVESTTRSKNQSVEELRSTNPANECQTCKNRKYQDRSSDPTVSFQMPTHLDPLSAEAAVVRHEQEHVSHEKQKAAQEHRDVVAVRVDIRHGICPECGRTYVEGGETTVITQPHSNSVSPSSSSNDHLLDVFA